MRIMFLSCLFLTGCLSTPVVEEVPDIIPVEVQEPALTPEDEYIQAVEEMIEDRNRLQRQLHSISTYKLDLPTRLREAIHCGEADAVLIAVPTADYLKVAHSLVTNPKQMEDLLMSYIKALTATIERANMDMIAQRDYRKSCYSKLKHGG